jgi:hypothetical protein
MFSIEMQGSWIFGIVESKRCSAEVILARLGTPHCRVQSTRRYRFSMGRWFVTRPGRRTRAEGGVGSVTHEQPDPA